MQPSDIDARFADLERKLTAMRWRMRITSVAALAVVAIVSCASKAPPTKLEFKDGDQRVNLSADGLFVASKNRTVLVNDSGVYVTDADPKLGERSSNYNAGMAYFRDAKGSSITLHVDELGADLRAQDPSGASAVVSADQGAAQLRTAKTKGEEYAELTAGLAAPRVTVRNQRTEARLASFDDSATMFLHAGIGDDRDVFLTSRPATTKK